VISKQEKIPGETASRYRGELVGSPLKTNEGGEGEKSKESASRLPSTRTARKRGSLAAMSTLLGKVQKRFRGIARRAKDAELSNSTGRSDLVFWKRKDQKNRGDFS